MGSIFERPSDRVICFIGYNSIQYRPVAVFGDVKISEAINSLFSFHHPDMRKHRFCIALLRRHLNIDRTLGDQGIYLFRLVVLRNIDIRIQVVRIFTFLVSIHIIIVFGWKAHMLFQWNWLRRVTQDHLPKEKSDNYYCHDKAIIESNNTSYIPTVPSMQFKYVCLEFAVWSIQLLLGDKFT